MDIKVGIRDKRQPGWYQIDNEVYDLGLSCEGLAIYNAIARYANNETEKAYFSGKKWKKHHRVGHGKLCSGIRELLSHKLIAATGSKTSVGALYYELCNINHLKVSQGRTGGCSTSEQGGVLPQNTNKTNKTKQENKTEKAAAWLVKNDYGKETKIKVKKTIDLSPIEPVLKVLRETDKNADKSISLNLRNMIRNEIELNGEEFVCNAVRGRVAQAKATGKALYLSTFFDPDNAEWRSDCARVGEAAQNAPQGQETTSETASAVEAMHELMMSGNVT